MATWQQSIGELWEGRDDTNSKGNRLGNQRFFEHLVTTFLASAERSFIENGKHFWVAFCLKPQDFKGQALDFAVTHTGNKLRPTAPSSTEQSPEVRQQDSPETTWHIFFRFYVLSPGLPIHRALTLCFQICRHLEVPMDRWWLPQMNSWKADYPLAGLKMGLPPQVTAMSIGAMDDQLESIIIVFLGIRINCHSFFLVAYFQINPWNGLKWYRENCHVFLVDFVIGGWNTSRQPYMVCPNIPNSHSGSSLSLLSWQHVGLSPFLDINPSSCGFSVEFAPVGRQNICWTSTILRWWMEACDISYAGNSVEPWPRTISWWQMGEVDSGHPDVSNGKKSGLPTTCDVQKQRTLWVNSSVSRHSQRSYESYLCVYIIFVDYIWHIISHYIPILSWVISPTAGTISPSAQVSSARKVKGMCGLPTPVPQRCCWDWLPTRPPKGPPKSCRFRWDKY